MIERVISLVLFTHQERVTLEASGRCDGCGHLQVFHGNVAGHDECRVNGCECWDCACGSCDQRSCLDLERTYSRRHLRVVD